MTCKWCGKEIQPVTMTGITVYVHERRYDTWTNLQDCKWQDPTTGIHYTRRAQPAKEDNHVRDR